MVFRELAILVFDPHPAKLSVTSYNSQQASWRVLLAIPVKQTTMVIITINYNKTVYIIVRV